MGGRPGGDWPGPSTTLVGVMGDPVAHSLSPLLHNTAFAALGLDWASTGFLVPPGGAAGALEGVRSLGLAGVSVTMPHKAAVAALVDERTEGEGFVASLRRGAGFEPAGRRCLVVGAGGAARAVVLALADAGAAEVMVVNRSPERAARAAALAGAAGRVGGPDEAGAVDLVVNATPAGMAGGPAPDERPAVDPGSLEAGQVVADLVYHPRETPWLAAARSRGVTTIDGVGMLVHQAAAQLLAWTGEEPPVQAMWAAVERALGGA